MASVDECLRFYGRHAYWKISPIFPNTTGSGMWLLEYYYSFGGNIPQLFRCTWDEFPHLLRIKQIFICLSITFNRHYVELCNASFINVSRLVETKKRVPVTTEWFFLGLPQGSSWFQLCKTHYDGILYFDRHVYGYTKVECIIRYYILSSSICIFRLGALWLLILNDHRI